MATFKWTVEFTVDETWVADGFNIDDERAEEMLESALPYAYPCERTARVLAKPDADAVAKAQGYSSARAAGFRKTAGRK